MEQAQPIRVHLITGGFPPGLPAGHDMDYARLRILQLLREHAQISTTVSNDFTDIARWLPHCHLLITYVAGPYPDEEENQAIRQWLDAGGRWFALHGTSGGKAMRVGPERTSRQMVKTAHHATLGSFFLNHPPLRKFRVTVTDRHHALASNLPESFEVIDELYMIELQEPATTQVFLTTELDKDPSPAGFGFVYEKDTSVLADGKTRVLGYTRPCGKGGVAYVALGHCHAPTNNRQRIVDASVQAEGNSPQVFRGSWESAYFEQVLRNGILWGIGQGK